VSDNCPTDAFKPATEVCRASAGVCDAVENCTGTEPACPADAFESAATLCTGASQGGACDNDAADHCTGTSNACVDVFQAVSFTCRADAGQCDVAETCMGTSGACPADAFELAGTTCNDGNACTVGDQCSGASNTCSGTVNWSGVLQPINSDGSSVFKYGSTVPTKFKLTGAAAGISTCVAKLYLTKMGDTVPSDVNAVTSTSAADTGNMFRYDPTNDQYIFNLATKSPGLSTGTWYMRIVFVNSDPSKSIEPPTIPAARVSFKQ